MNKRLIVLVGILLLLLGFSLAVRESSSPEQGVGTTALKENQGSVEREAVRAIQILPASPNLQSTLRVVSNVARFIPSDYRYRWFVNEKEVGQEATLFLGRFRAGDFVSVEMTPLKEDAALPVTASVTIGNNLPQIKEIRLAPIPVFSGQAVRAEVIAEDADRDFIHFTYEWTVNGQPIQNDQDTLSGDYVHSADTIFVGVIPSDPFSEGKRHVSPIVTVSNRPPEIFSHPPRVDTKGEYRYPVTARDPDGDTLHYRLIEAPPAMEMDSATGVLTWTVAALPENESGVSIEVSDAKGGKIVQQFTLRTTTR